MEFGLSPDEAKTLEEIHNFLEREVTLQVIEETLRLGSNYGGPEARKVVQKMGAKGWLCPTWPKEYGGLSRSELLRFMILDEMAYMGLPWIFVGINMAGPTILRFGTEEQRRQLLPPIARGEVEYALGYTEPQAGSDLASLEMRAEDKGDHFIVSGQKMFNTHCHIADNHWLAARTDPSAPKHKGISLMIVDLKSPGITVRPMTTMGGWQTNEVFYDDVLVPKKNLIGEMNRGFYYIMTALDFERMFPIGTYRRLFEDLVQYVRETTVDGIPLGKNCLVRQRMAEIATELEGARLLFYNLAFLLDKGQVPSYQASMEKLFATEMAQHLTNAGMQIMALLGQLAYGSKYAPLQGMMEHHYRSAIIDTVVAGTSEIQRNIIALRGLGLPAR